jgi:hypothetical protein
MKNLALAALSIAAILLTPAIASAHPDRNWQDRRDQDRVIIYSNQNGNQNGVQNRDLDRNWNDDRNQNRVIIYSNQNRERYSDENRNRYEYNNYRNDYSRQNDYARLRYYQELERRRLYETRTYNDRPIFGINLRIGQ